MKLLIFGIALFGSIMTSSAATYYFSVTGDDRNDGTSISAPKKSLSAAMELAAAGNRLLFRRGDAWYSPFNPLDLSNKSGDKSKPVIIDAYGAGEKPIIAGLYLLDDAGWKNIAGTNTWTHDVDGFSKAYRLFVDGVSKYRVNTSDSSANETNVDKPFKWYIKEVEANKSGIVYLNTGSPEKAPRHVEIHPFRSKSIVLMEKTSHIVARNIDFRGGASYNVIHIIAPCSDITFDSCVIQRGNGSGLLAGNLAEGDRAPYVSNLNVLNCLIDKVWAEYENDPAKLLSGDGIFLLHAVDGGLIRGNKVTNWGHSGIAVTNYAEGVHGVHNIIVELNDVSAGNSGYTHALDMNGYKGMTTHNVIRRNYFHDYTVPAHILGSYNRIYSNIFAGVKYRPMPRHSRAPWGADWSIWQERGVGPWIEARDNLLVNNTFADAEEMGIVASDHPENTNAVTNNVIANNIICSFGKLGVKVTSGVRGTIYILHNNFWSGNSTAPVVMYKNPNTLYNAADLNKYFPECCRNNTQLDPAFEDAANRNFRLTEKSPAELKSGGTAEYIKVLGKEFVDYYGKKWDPKHPSMGAIQF